MDYVIIDQDQVIFESQQGAATITPVITTIPASGEATVNDKKICVFPDYKKVTLHVNYINGAFVNGQGDMTIDSLNDDQIAKVSFDNYGIPLILKGSKFNSKLTVTTPAIAPGSPPTSDLTPIYMGNGIFINGQSVVHTT